MTYGDCWGVAGQAYQATLNAEMPEHSSNIGAWIIHIIRPGGVLEPHLFMVGHLRPVDFPDGNTLAPYRQYAEAEHEMVLARLDPDAGPIPTDWTTLMPLMPLSVAHHFHGMTDEEVGVLGRHVVKCLVEGKLPPVPTGEPEFRLWEDTIARLKEKITGRPEKPPRRV